MQYRLERSASVEALWQKTEQRNDGP